MPFIFACLKNISITIKTQFMENHTDIETLWTKYFEGSTTPPENEQIEAWLNADEEHLHIAKQLNTLYLAVDTQHITKKIDTEKALDKVKSKTKVRHLFWWGWTQRIAAIMSIPLLIGVLALYPNKQQPTVVAQMMEVKTNAGMTTSIILPDSTVVHLNSESSLRYPAFFADDVRKVELNGEAYFDVTPNPKKQFIISIPYHSQVEVYGTSFNVEAYGNETPISTTLIKGSIGFIYKNNKGQYRKNILSPKQKLIYSPQTGDVKCYATTGESEISWKDGKLIFDDTPLDEVLHMLGKRFNVEFILSNKKLMDCSFTGTFTRQHLECIMEYFRISSKIKWRYIANTDIKTEKLKIEVY